MKRTSSLAALSALAVTSPSMAFDVYLPVAPKTIEADLMFTHQAALGSYDMDGKKQDLPSGVSPALETPSLQVKYGIMDGLDAGFQLDFGMYNKDMGKKFNETTFESEAVSGLEAPSVFVKYAHPEFGAGAFVNVGLPMGSEDIVGKKPATAIEGGLIYGKTFGQVVVNATASYTFNTEVEKVKQDAMEVKAQGQFNVNEQVGPYLGLDYSMDFEETVDGTATKDSDSYLLTVYPGTNYKINDAFAAEIAVPVTVMGKNDGALWGVYAGVYYSIGL
ncbi:MAG: hypothetical protein H6686_03335 [Fibrobacteria bacterium]|nr:hypothetical protein [Fibrobacteria bacterium]